MAYSPFLQEILERLVTPRVNVLLPPAQNDLIGRLLSASDADLTNRPHAGCLRSLLLLQAGEFERSHSIVQEMTGSEAAYIHGMIHRTEGDYSNAKYWFRRAQRDLISGPEPAEAIQITDAVAKIGGRVPDARVIQSLQAEFESVLRSLV
jgi:hypothetical protein